MFFESYNSASFDRPYVDEAIDINYLSHFHNELEVALVTEGEVFAFSESVCYEASKGDLLIFMPSELHSYSTPKSSKLIIIKIDTVRSSDATDFSSLRMKSNLIKGDDGSCSSIRKAIISILAEEQTKQVGYTYMMDSLSKSILCSLLRSSLLSEIKGDDIKKRKSYASLLSSTDEYVRENYMNNISLNDVAAYCNLSVFYFSHVFKRATNSTFYDYLTAYRLDRAMTLLKTTNKKIINIAVECGFDTARTFNRSFKKFFGCSPTQYLNNGRRGTV